MMTWIHARASRHLAWLTLAVVSLWPTVAWASGGGKADNMFRTILLLLGVIGVAYLITHFVSEWFQERFGVVTGVEYMVLGALVGVLGLVDSGALDQLAPAMVLGTGSLGLLTGLQLDFRRFDEVDVEALRVGLWTTLGTVATVVVIPLVIAVFVLPNQVVMQWLPGLLCVGALAQVADPGLLRSLQSFLASRGGATELATRVARICSSLAVIGFGLLFCLYDHSSIVMGDEHFAAIEWFVIHLILGVVLGFIFAGFLRREFEEEKALTVIIGMVIFTSGVAYYLKLSPIFVNFILGVVLIASSPGASQVRQKLENIERPLYIVLFFFVGAGLTLKVPIWAYLAVVPYIFLRSAGRFFGGVIATKTSSVEARTPHLGRVLLAPGGLSVAMVLDFKGIYGELSIAAPVYTGLVLAILLSEIVSYVRTRAWLIDFTDVPPNQIYDALRGDDMEVA